MVNSLPFQVQLVALNVYAVPLVDGYSICSLHFPAFKLAVVTIQFYLVGISFKVKLLKSILQNLSQGRGAGRRLTIADAESLSNVETRNMRRPSSSSVAGGLPPLGRFTFKTLL